MTHVPDEIQHYEKKIFDLRQLLEISRALNSTLDYEYLIQAVLDMCLAQVQTLSAALFLTPEMDSDSISLVDGFKGFDLQKAFEDYQISLDSPLLEHFEQYNKAQSIEEIEKNLGNIPSTDLIREMGAELVVPVKAKGKIMGLIVLGEKVVGGEYPDAERTFLVDLASLGGVAVDNARLYERATVDMMTSLKNHAYFQSKFKEDRERAIRRKLPLALLLTDIDKFKVFNDTHGHQAGDDVLKEVANVLIQSARPQDTPARYGGEEFCIVMPGADKEKALEMGEKIRSTIEQMVVMHEGKEMKVTISVGVALVDPDQDLKTNKTMIERADRALYACKDGGRNQVQLFKDGM